MVETRVTVRVFQPTVSASALTVARGHVRWLASLVLALMAVLLALALVVS